MKKVNLMSRAEMKNVLGGVESIEPGEGGGTDGRCVRCECHSGSTSCWYSRRSTHALCVDVCGSAMFSALDNIDCSSCTMN